MLHRRNAILGMCASFWAFIACRRKPRDLLSARSRTSRLAAPAQGAFEQALLRDLERAGSRAYSEEGIPVFLVGENLADGKPTGGRGLVADPFRARLAADFARAAEALPRVRPPATTGDVGKLIEVLAERDFGSVANPPRP